MKRFFLRHKGLHLWLLGDLAALAAFALARHSRAAMNALTEGFTNPLRRALGALCERVPFSVAEGLYILAALGLLAYLALGVRAVTRSGRKGGAVYALVLGLAAALATVYALFCLLWGANYYADGFAEKSGLSPDPVAVEDLERVTRQFAEWVNEYAPAVPRHADGTFAVDRADILAYAPEVYEGLYEEFPFLEMTDVPPKAMFFSRVMSAMGFTGFDCPLTGETLDGRAAADLRASSEYWAQFEGLVDTVSTAVYDGFLKSYGTIGVKSYGACVDLLTAYFK